MSESILSVDSTLSSSATGRPKRAVVTWEYSQSPNDDKPDYNKNNNLIWYCKHYINYHYTSTITTQNHLFSKHNIRIEESRQLIISKEKTISNILEPSNILSVEYINEALFQFIIWHNLLFRVIEWLEIYTLLTIQYPEIGKGILSSYSSISKKINSI